MPSKKPRNYALLSTLSLIIFLPLGVISQYYAFKVDNLYYTGEEERANKASKKALIFAISSIVIGLIGIVSLIFAVMWLTSVLISSLQTFSIDTLISETLLDTLNNDSSTVLENETISPELLEGLDLNTENIEELNMLLENMNKTP